MTEIDSPTFLAWFTRAADAFQQAQEELTALDREIGDGDHGINMQRGFHKVKEKLAGAPAQSLDATCKTVGMTLLSSVGGASGPLYGTFFLKAAASLAGAEKIDLPLLAKMVAAGTDGIQARGKAQLGDKTMMDVWLPVNAFLQAAAQENQSLTEALTGAAALAAEKADETIAMVAKKGRASYLGERSAGHKDAGAVSSAILLRTLAEVTL